MVVRSQGYSDCSAPPWWGQRSVVSTVGIRGIGSFYYPAFALAEASFAGRELLVATEPWALVGVVVLTSNVAPGISASAIMDLSGRARDVADGPQSLRRVPPVRSASGGLPGTVLDRVADGLPAADERQVVPALDRVLRMREPVVLVPAEQREVTVFW